MSALEPVRLETPRSAPGVWLLDASGHAEAALRTRAAELSKCSGVAHTSRSYRFPYALVAAHWAPVGLDIERVQAADLAFVESISTPEEWRAAQSDEPEYAASLWSSKEALAKALGNAVDYDPRRLGSPVFWPGGASGPWRAVRLPVPAGHVGWLCWHSDASDPELV